MISLTRTRVGSHWFSRHGLLRLCERIMGVIAALFALVIVLLAWIAFVPVMLRVNSEKGVATLHQPGIFRFWLSQDFRPRLRIVGLQLQLGGRTVKRRQASTRRKKSTTFYRFTDVSRLLARIKDCIQITRWLLDVDTGDVVLNARLFPVAYWLNQNGQQWVINNEGRVVVILHARIWVYKLLLAFLLFSFTKKHSVWK